METTTDDRVESARVEPTPRMRLAAFGPARRGWAAKFGEAIHGIRIGMQGQSSFFVHFFFASLAIAAALVLDCTSFEWCLVLGCIGLVFTAELFNTAIEILFRGLAPEARDRVHPCLHVAAGAVLVASATAVAVGGIVFGRRLLLAVEAFPG